MTKKERMRDAFVVLIVWKTCWKIHVPKSYPPARAWLPWGFAPNGTNAVGLNADLAPDEQPPNEHRNRDAHQQQKSPAELSLATFLTRCLRKRELPARVDAELVVHRAHARDNSNFVSKLQSIVLAWNGAPKGSWGLGPARG